MGKEGRRKVKGRDKGKREMGRKNGKGKVTREKERTIREYGRREKERGK